MSEPLAPARMALAALAMTIFAGCAHSPGSAPVTRSLPPAETLVAGPVAVPAVRAGDDARTALARDRAALLVCNDRLRTSRLRVEQVRRAFAAQGG